MSATIVVQDRFALAAPAPAHAVPACSPPNWWNRLRCPRTGRKLLCSADRRLLTCDAGSYPVRDGVPLLLDGQALNRAKAWRPTNHQARRQRIWSLVPAPVSGRRQRRWLGEFLAARRPDELILNLGSGGWRLSSQVVNVDALPFAGVDLCADIHRLPFGPGEVDAIVCTGVLEHITDPAAAVAEFRRVLRPGGAVLCTVPFMQPYHEDPEDYRRFTPTGLRQLFAAFSSARVRPSHGVGSGLAWVAADALAAALAGNANKLHTAWLMLFRFAFAPLRLLDRLSEGSPFEHIACSALMIEAGP